MRRIISTKVLLLLGGILSAGLSTAFAKLSVMDKFEGYTDTLLRALPLNDKPNIQSFAVALTELSLYAKVNSDKQQKSQMYGGKKLAMQIEEASHGFRLTRATSKEAAIMSRAIETLAFTYHIERRKQLGGTELTRYLGANFFANEQDSRHCKVVKKRFSTALDLIERGARDDFDALEQLIWASYANKNLDVPYAASTYVGTVNVCKFKELGDLPTNAFQDNPWIKEFRVRIPIDDDQGFDNIKITRVKKFTDPCRAETAVPKWQADRDVIATHLEAQENKNFNEIVEGLRDPEILTSDIIRKLRTRAGDLTFSNSTTTASDRWDEFDATLKALEALWDFDAAAFKEANVNKSWSYVGSRLVLRYVNGAFEEKLSSYNIDLYSKENRDIKNIFKCKKLAQFVKELNCWSECVIRVDELEAKDTNVLSAVVEVFKIVGRTRLGQKVLEEQEIDVTTKLAHIEQKIANPSLQKQRETIATSLETQENFKAIVMQLRDQRTTTTSIIRDLLELTGDGAFVGDEFRVVLEVLDKFWNLNLSSLGNAFNDFSDYGGDWDEVICPELILKRVQRFFQQKEERAAASCFDVSELKSIGKLNRLVKRLKNKLENAKRYKKIDHLKATEKAFDVIGITEFGQRFLKHQGIDVREMFAEITYFIDDIRRIERFMDALSGSSRKQLYVEWIDDDDDTPSEDFVAKLKELVGADHRDATGLLRFARQAFETLSQDENGRQALFRKKIRGVNELNAMLREIDDRLSKIGPAPDYTPPT